jgi:hypothetical protein
VLDSSPYGLIREAGSGSDFLRCVHLLYADAALCFHWWFLLRDLSRVPQPHLFALTIVYSIQNRQKFYIIAVAVLHMAPIGYRPKRRVADRHQHREIALVGVGDLGCRDGQRARIGKR